MKITISIPTPCHADWNAMSPRQQGRHCAQCDQVVADLTRVTDAELVALFTSDTKPKCARFHPAQLDRVLDPGQKHRQHALPLAAFTTLVAVAAGQEAMAQGAPFRRPPPSVGEPAITRPAPPPPVLKGKVMPLPAPDVPRCDHVITGDTVIVPVQDPDPVLQHIETGNVMIQGEGTVREVPDPSTDGTRPIPIGEPLNGEGPLGIKGFVEDRRTGRMVPEAIIHLRGTEVRVRCNERGYFGLQVPAEKSGGELVLDIQVPGAGGMALPLPPNSTPFYAPVKFLPEEPNSTTELTPFVIERGWEREEVATLGGAIAMAYHRPPTFWQRLTSPIRRGWYTLRH